MAEKISKQPSINFMVSDSARKIIDKIVANIGVKKRNDEACATPPCCNAKNLKTIMKMTPQKQGIEAAKS